MLKTSRRRLHANDINGDLARIKELIGETAFDVKDVAEDAYENALDTTRHVKHNIEDFAHENPFKLMGVTFLVGIVVGFLIHR